MFLKHTVSEPTVKTEVCEMTCFKVKPALERPRFRKATSNKCIQFLFSDIDFEFGMGILWNLAFVAIYDSRANVFLTQC